ncbi:restriction endonuclease subunit S [Leptotrichia massiliensis]|uniref:restriction endonuclease subunit S n=1 Tax=Leptotrichia massiliensis TaxID=1852388 RepID=UPI0008DAEDD0|nr:restriction endonuclease subunit S [Leptotrichia massiliensis]
MVRIELKEIVSNYDNKRKALNAVERGNKKTNPQYPYYGANGIVDFIDEYIFDEELLCIAEDGGNWGYKQNCSYIVNGKYWVNNHVHVLKPKKNVEIKYLMYYLNYTDLTSYITGTTRGKLTRTALDKIQINLPELEIQREIVIILDKINNLIEKNKKRIIYLEELVKSRFIEMFGDPIKNDKGWDKIFIEEIASLVSRGKTPKYVEKSKIGVINQACVYWEKTKFENIKYHEDKKDILILQDQDILINSTGTGTLGRVNIFMKNEEKDIIYTIDTHITLLRLKQWKSNSIYLKNYFRIPIIQKYLINKCVNGSTNQIELSKEKFNNFRVLLPPLSLQNEFSQFVEKTDKLKFEAEKSLKEMENLYDSLMQKFFKQ